MAEKLHQRLARAHTRRGHAGRRRIAVTRNLPARPNHLSKSAAVDSVALRSPRGDMTGDEFTRLLGDFTLSEESGDGARFASHVTEDANKKTKGRSRWTISIFSTR